MRAGLVIVQTLLISSLVIISSIIVGILLRNFLLAKLIHFAKKTKYQFDDIILEGLKSGIVFWSIALGIYYILKNLNLPANVIYASMKILTVLIIFSVTVVAAKIGVLIVDHYRSLFVGLASTSSLLKNIVRIAIYSIGTLFILDYLEIHIAPLLTALGVGGLAIGLGLQETLSNFFAGLQILAANQIKVGDYIRLSSNDEGFVEDMNWRATVVRTLSGNHVIIPNKNLAGLIITNYQEPAPEMSIVFNLGVDYSSDLEKVEKVTVEVAKEVQSTVPGAVRDFQPFIRFNEFGNSSINFSVIMRGESYVDQYLIKHEFIKKLKKRYDEEGIRIPFPARTVYINQGLKQDE